MDRGVKRVGDSMMEETKVRERKTFYCELCDLELPNESTLKQHELGQKHKKLLIAKEEKLRIDQKCGIYVRGFTPNMTQDVILNYFSQFGKIVWIHFGHGFLLLDYDKSESAEKVIMKTHFLGGRHLIVKYRELRKQVNIKMKEEESTEFIEELKDIPKFYDQVQKLIRHLQPDLQQQFPKYNKIYYDLRMILSKPFPYCRIFPFGSTITGLNFNMSDVDVFISGIKQDDNDTPYLYRIKKLLLNSNRFGNAIVIPHAKIPILKCVHIETGISCDINLKNMLGVCNSLLIDYYLNIDQKIRMLMMAIKYWAKIHGLSGQNNLFSNYSLCMMLIFFLQQEPYNIPSVFSLQQNPQFADFHDGWNGGFQPFSMNSFNNSPLSTLRDTSLLKLLEKFFSYYTEFEYGVNIICPYFGRPIKKDIFKNPELLPVCYYFYKEYIKSNLPLKVDTYVCIQDPFEHSRNTTPIVSESKLETFIDYCRLGKKLCEDRENCLLYNLLTQIPKCVRSQTVIKADFGQFAITKKQSLKYIEQQINNTEDRYTANQKIWFNNTEKFIITALKDFLKFEVSEINSSESSSKSKRDEGQQDVYDKKSKYSVCYKCEGKINLWNARKSVARQDASIQNIKGIVEKERAITEKLCDSYKLISQEINIIEFEVNLEHSTEPPEIIIKLKKIDAFRNSFRSFIEFLSAKLPSWFERYEKEQNEKVDS